MTNKNISLTKEERLMYQVMMAIYKSGIPINFKGSMVLKACLLENGYDGEIRHTADIDANWLNTDFITVEQITNSLQKAIDKENIQLRVITYRMFAPGRSAGFELRDTKTDELIFTMDIDIRKQYGIPTIYQIEDFKFSGISPITIMADKLTVISSDKVFRRIKDLVDMYYFSKVIIFDKDTILDSIKQNNRQLGDFDSFINRYEDLKHSYDKFKLRDVKNKPDFNEVYNSVKEYIKKFLH